MADPLSITASIVAVLQITSKITQYLKDVRGGSEDRMRLRDEMRSIICLLEMLKDRVEDPDTRDIWVDAVRLLDGPNGPLIQFRKAVELLVQKLTPRRRVQQVTQVLKWPFDKAEVNEVLGTIERLKSLFSLAMQNDHIKLSHAIREDVQEISRGLAELQVSQKYQEDQLHDEERRKILDWISPLTFSAKQGDILSRKQEGTCEWFFETSIFQSWLNGAARTLWCPGIPGAGKTILAAAIISYLRNAFPKSNISLAFIYCNYKEQDEQTIIGLVASLLRQVVERCESIPNEVQELYTFHVARATRPVLTDYSKLLGLIAARFSTVFIVVDALDESNESDGTRSGLIREILKLPPNSQLLCTSRHIPDIEQQFEGSACLEVRASDRDVEKYLVERIEQSARLKRHAIADPSLVEAITSNVVAKVDGMLFLLAQLHVDSLARKHDRKAIRSALQKLPTELDDIYHEALGRVYRQNSDDVLLAERVLSWISFAVRPLKIKEIQHAIAVMNLEPDETRIDDEGIPDEDLLVAVCAGLVTIDKEDRVIRLVHYTAQQYFERIRETRFPHAQVLITQACFRYMSLSTLDDINPVTQSGSVFLMATHPLLQYAGQYWGHHAIGRPERVIEDQILEFLASDTQILYSVQAMIYIAGHELYLKNRQADYRLWLAAAFGLKDIIQVLLGKGVDIESTGFRKETALHIAASQGHAAVVQLLLDHVANTETKTLYGRTALHNAAENGHEAVVQILLKGGANIDCKDDTGQTALYRAAMGGQLAVVKLLLEHGADQEFDPLDDYSPIDAALWARDWDIFQLLLKNSANASASPEVFQALVYWCRDGGIPEEVLSATGVHNGLSYHITCDNCETGILDVDVHYHCDICSSNDFDLCQRCVDDGQHCLSKSHQLIKKRYLHMKYLKVTEGKRYKVGR